MSALDGLPLFEVRVARFNGPHEAEDVPRFATQLADVREFMFSGCWHTLTEIAAAAKCTTQSASARVRDLRKSRHGGFTVERQRIPGTAVYKYRIPTWSLTP